MSLQEHLKSLVFAFESIRAQNGFEFSCQEQFVLEHGREWTAAKLPGRFSRMTPRECFMNATNLVLEDPSLTYVEGFAAGVIPVHHAWVVDLDGSVIDPTWKDPENSTYFGVPFEREYLLETIQESGYYGLIDNFKMRWPLLTGADPKSKFFSKRFMS